MKPKFPAISQFFSTEQNRRTMSCERNLESNCRLNKALKYRVIRFRFDTNPHRNDNNLFTCFQYSEDVSRLI